MAGVRIGTAGWSLPPGVQSSFPPGTSHLARYAQVFGAVEINSSFHRPHRRSTWEKWAASVPPGFAFSAKLPKAITHERRLAGAEDLLDEFFGQAAGLGAALRCVLVQLPPSLGFEESVAGRFVDALRARHAGSIALEPRHAQWFEPEIDGWLARQKVARVLADPVRCDAGREPGGWRELVYVRLHGSPRTYYSAYDPGTLAALAASLQREQALGRETWCMFDNTAGQAAAGNALQLQSLLAQT